MLRSAYRRQVLSAANPPIGVLAPGRFPPEKGLERRRRRLSTIAAKGELIEIDLQVRPTDPVMRAHEPLLKISDRAVGQEDEPKAPKAPKAP